MPILIEAGQIFALIAFVIIAVQLILTARFKWMERAVGLDRLYRFHALMGITAGVLLLAHPVLIAWGGGHWRLIYGLSFPWFIWLGRITLVVLVIQIMISSLRLLLKLEYEAWRRLHNILALTIVIGGFLHSWEVGEDMQEPVGRVLWIVIATAAVSAYLYHRIARPLILSRHPYLVDDVRQETHDVFTISFKPAGGRKPFSHLPGQFHFVTLKRDRDLSPEEHPFTIASSPTEEGLLRSTIKQSGDFTATIGETRRGDIALLDGPFGRFSYMSHDDNREPVFIAGGIGITPLMSMLRHMRDTKSDRRVILIYANKGEDDIVFRDELEDIQSGGHPGLSVVHVLSQAGGTWQGERGHVDGKILERYCGPQIDAKSYFVCGPPPMMKSVTRQLKALGVAGGHIYSERFSLFS